MNKFYFEFKSVVGVNGSAHPNGQFRLAAAVVDQLHFENVRRKVEGLPRLAVAFPALASGDRDIMAVVRVFGPDSQSLEMFKTRATEGLGLEGNRAVAVSDVAYVPEKHQLAVFVRDRMADKETVGFAQRSLARAQRKVVSRIERGEVVKQSPMEMADRAGAAALHRESAVALARAYLCMDSRSTRQSFSLVVAAYPANDASKGEVDIYGLSRRTTPFSVPHF
jgi:CRISPR-associated endoribonuclease Cas6/Csy4 subtype I-F